MKVELTLKSDNNSIRVLESYKNRMQATEFDKIKFQ